MGVKVRTHVSDETLKGNDPEQAHRARELLWKIQHNLTPETDPAVIKLVEQYAKASPEAKVNLFAELCGKRAWWQLLKLYANETGRHVKAGEPLFRVYSQQFVKVMVDYRLAMTLPGRAQRDEEGAWQVVTLSGLGRLVECEPVCHVSFYEADAFARWSGAR